MKRRKLSKIRLSGFNSENVKPKKRNFSAVIVGIIIFIMIFSSIAIAFFNSLDPGDNSSVEYNGFKFRNEGGGWFVNIGGGEYGFEYLPDGLGGINSADLSMVEFGVGDYILFDPSEFSGADYEINRLRGFFAAKGGFVSLGCIKEEGCNGFPVKSCDNARAVLLRRGENTQIYKENNCVVLESRDGDEIAVINRFMYGILGVI